MAQYSDTIDRLLLQPELLRKLCPKEPLSWDLVLRLRATDDATLAGTTKLHAVGLLRGALYYALDALDDGHKFFQDEPGDLGSYWHGMMHRREGDFDNGRYWFRRAGRMPFFAKLHEEARGESLVIARQPTWDPYLFTGECEQAHFGAETEPELAKVQRAEFEVVFDYTWRQALQASPPA